MFVALLEVCSVHERCYCWYRCCGRCHSAEVGWLPLRRFVMLVGMLPIQSLPFPRKKRFLKSKSRRKRFLKSKSRKKRFLKSKSRKKFPSWISPLLTTLIITDVVFHDTPVCMYQQLILFGGATHCHTNVPLHQLRQLLPGSQRYHLLTHTTLPR